MSNGKDSPAAWKRKVAVALRYRRELDAAPTVVAAGAGIMAERIEETAVQNSVPIHQDAPLAESLGRIGVDRPIPPELYQAVAEVISFVYRLRPAGAF